jgi:hypothetical protein
MENNQQEKSIFSLSLNFDVSELCFELITSEKKV